MKTKIKPSSGWAIVDTFDNTIMERTGTGLLNIFYARVDAEIALPGIKAGSDEPTAQRLAIVELKFAEVQLQPQPTDRAARREAAE